MFIGGETEEKYFLEPFSRNNFGDPTVQIARKMKWVDPNRIGYELVEIPRFLSPAALSNENGCEIRGDKILKISPMDNYAYPGLVCSE